MASHAHNLAALGAQSHEPGRVRNAPPNRPAIAPQLCIWTYKGQRPGMQPVFGIHFQALQHMWSR